MLSTYRDVFIIYAKCTSTELANTEYRTKTVVVVVVTLTLTDSATLYYHAVLSRIALYYRLLVYLVY